MTLPVNDGWKCRSTSANGMPSRELFWCAAAMCCFSPPEDLQTFGHRLQGNPLEVVGGMEE